MRDLLLLSNSASPGLGFLEHELDAIAAMLPPDGRRLLFVPFASGDPDSYTEAMTAALAPLTVQVTGAHRCADPVRAVAAADAVFVGDGNSFRLLRALQDGGLLTAIAGRVRAGMPYLGASAGTNMACPTLRTSGRLFSRGAGPRDLPPGSDVSALLAVQPRFDVGPSSS